MKIGIIGSGPSGVFAALKLADLDKGFDIEIIDKESKPLKKLRATGNGHCNLLPETFSKKNFNQSHLLSDFNGLDPLLNQFSEWGIPLRLIEGIGYYPASYSAPSFANYLLEMAKDRGIRFSLERRVIDFRKQGEKIILTTDKGEEAYDHLIIATGGKSHSELGSDGSLFEILAKHGIKVKAPKAGLTPLKLGDDDLKELDGVRHEAKVSLVADNAIIYEEEGEILYRKKGISGIVIFNVQREWVHACCPKAKLRIDLFPKEKEEELEATFAKYKSILPRIFLKGFLVEPLAKHLENRLSKGVTLGHLAKNLEYMINGDEGLSSSQVTIGGVAEEEQNPDFSLRKEPRISVIGEAVDVDGKCGGNNLAFCLYSALKAAQGLAKK